MRQLLVVAALVGIAEAVGEYSNPLAECGCAGLQTWTQQTTAYCPSTSYPSCDVTRMIETSCLISCPGPRGQFVYRNNTAVYQATDYLMCEIDGNLYNADGKKVINPPLVRPNCAYRTACNKCGWEVETSCPAGYTCTPAHLVQSTADDDCTRLKCAHGKLGIYQDHVLTNYTADQLYCTITGRWSNYSFDGAANGAGILSYNITANCQVPLLSQNCTKPTLATSLSQLPAPFRTGYILAAPIYAAVYGVPSLVTCPLGYNLYGFSGSATNVTGLEYTSRNYLFCEKNSMWTNGGFSFTPIGMTAACLQIVHPCGATYSFETSASLPTGCKSDLIATQALTGNQTCGIGCPAGYRMLVSRGGLFLRLSGSLTCDGMGWRGISFLADFDISFTLAEAKVTCEPSPFPVDFNWPLIGMEAEGCHNEHLTISNGELVCASGYNLVVSVEKKVFMRMFTLSSMYWNGKMWNGYEKGTGKLQAFSKKIFITCYSGIPPTVPPPTLPYTGSTTPVPTTTEPITTTVPVTTAPVTGPTCGYHDVCPCTGVTIGCGEGGRDEIRCDVHQSVKIVLSTLEVKFFERMVFVFGHGWLAFSCDGSMMLLTAVEMQTVTSITCEISSGN